MKDILEKLKGGDRRSIGRANEVVADVLRDHTLFEAVFNGMLSDDPIIRMRAADAVEKITVRHPEFLQPYKSRLIRQAAKINQQEVRWHVAEMIPRLKLSKKDLAAVVEILLDYLNDKSNIVKTFAMQGATTNYSHNMNFTQLPKIELHLHLDCSLSFEIVSRLNPSITREEYQSDFIAPVKCTNLADFLTRAPKGIQLMQTEHELRLVTEDLFQQLQSDGVIYAEIRFAPLFHSEKGLLPEEVVGIVEETAAKASTATGVEARLILCTLRHFTNALGLYQHDSAHDLCSQGFQAMLYGIVAVIIYSIFPSSKRKALRFCLQSAIFLRGRNG